MGTRLDLDCDLDCDPSAMQVDDRCRRILVIHDVDLPSEVVVHVETRPCEVVWHIDRLNAFLNCCDDELAWDRVCTWRVVSPSFDEVSRDFSVKRLVFVPIVFSHPFPLL